MTSLYTYLHHTIVYFILVIATGISLIGLANACEEHEKAASTAQGAAITANQPALPVALVNLQKQWAHSKYQLSGNKQKSSYKRLVEDAERITIIYPDLAEAWIWQGIIKASTASTNKGVSALVTAKEARKDLEKGLDMNNQATDGFGAAVLAALYYKVPRSPIGFKDTQKAESWFQTALEQNPDNLHVNYLYAQYLIKEKRDTEAKTLLDNAILAAADTSNPQVAGIQGRLEEARLLLDSI